MNKNRLGVAITIFAAVCWGFSGTCSEFLFKEYQTSSEWLTMVRLLFSGTVLIILSRLKGYGRLNIKLWTSKIDRRRMIIFAVFGLMFCQYTYLATISFTNSGTATILQYIAPVFIMIWACFSAQRLPKMKETIAIILVILGVFLLATNGQIGNLVLSRQGLVWGIVSAFALALYTILPGKLLGTYGTTIISGWGMFIGGLVFTLLFHPFGEKIIWDAGMIFGLFGLIVIGTLMSFSIFLHGVSLIGPVRASMIAAIEPVSAALFSHFWLGTPFTFIDIIGFIAILFAVYILNKPEHKHIVNQTD